MKRSPQTHIGVGARERGFTVIELAVVVAIIVVLTGLAIAVGARVVESGRTKATRDVLLTLDQALTAYVEANHGQIPGPIVLSQVNSGGTEEWLPVADMRVMTSGQPGPTINSVGLFIKQVSGFEQVDKVIHSVPSRYLKVNPADGLLTAYDAWGYPIRYVHPSFDELLYGQSNAATPNTQQARALTDGILDSEFAMKVPTGYQTLRRNNRTPTAAEIAAMQSGGQIGVLPDPGRREVADSDGGKCVGSRPYFYSAGEDANPGTVTDNVYVTLPDLPKAPAN